MIAFSANHPAQAPWPLNNQSVNGYAKPLAGSEFLRLYTTPDPTGSHSWFFAHRENANGAVHVVPIVTNDKGEEFIHIIIQKSPVLGGRPIVQLPAGIWGDLDPTEGATKAAERELKEETGYSVSDVGLLWKNAFATSPGMTTETKNFALAKAVGEPSDAFREPSEVASIIGSYDIPIEIFRNYDKFKQFMGKMEDKGYTIGMDILAARALLPPKTEGLKLNTLV